VHHRPGKPYESGVMCIFVPTILTIMRAGAVYWNVAVDSPIVWSCLRTDADGCLARVSNPLPQNSSNDLRAANSGFMPALSSIWIYPLKSAAGLFADSAVVERRGLAGDRRWMLVDIDGTFISQRTHPRLALIQVDVKSDGLRLSAPDQPPLDVPIPGPTALRQAVTVWGDDVVAAVANGEAHAWCTDYLRSDVRLVYMPDAARRTVEAAYAVRDDDIVSFADGYPLLLANSASLADLNARLESPLPMDRFRPNFVVNGVGPWAEDTWRRIRIGNVVLSVAKACGRCAVTTIDQHTATQGKEPLKTLATFRRRPETGKVYFGWYLIPETTGHVHTGESVEVLEYSEGIVSDSDRA
jgi:uncharacterized protein